MNDRTPALGIDLGGTKIEAALLAPDGSTAWRHRVATPAGDYPATLQAVAALVLQAREHAAGSVTVGVGSPGAATPDGLMKNCNSTCLNGRPLQRDLEALLGQPVALANDANCLAFSEASDGTGAGARVVFAAILGTGIGAGIAVHGRVLAGANGIAGEWGHNPLPWAEDSEDPRWLCYCGRSGCIETLVSGPGLARDHAARHGGTLDARAIAAAAAAGDADGLATLQRHAHRLARALASVINVLDPDVVVLGGGVSRIESLAGAVSALLPRWVFATGAASPLRTRVAPALHGDASGVRGAAWLGRTACLDPAPPAAGLHLR